MPVIPATLAEVATPETMGQQVIVVTAERAATAEAEAQAGAAASAAALPVTPAVMQVALLLATLEVAEGRAVVRAEVMVALEGQGTPNWIYPQVAAVAAAVQV